MHSFQSPSTFDMRLGGRLSSDQLRYFVEEKDETKLSFKANLDGKHKQNKTCSEGNSYTIERRMRRGASQDADTIHLQLSANQA